MNITYYAPDDRMTGHTPHSCSCYRDWVRHEISEAFPSHEVSVINARSIGTLRTDDPYMLYEIMEFCESLWRDCPWGWEERMA